MISPQGIRAVLAGKISRDHGPGNMGERTGSGSFAPRKFFDHALFCLKETPYFSTEIGHLNTKSCKNERAKMEESRQNDIEIKSTGR